MSKYTQLTKEAEEYFSSYFNENKLQIKNTLSFAKFREALMKYNRIPRDVASTFIDKTKANIIGRNYEKVNDKEIELTKQEYFAHIENVIYQNNKIQNQNDPEIKHIFDLLSNNNEVISRKYLENIITMFDLPINSQQFFSPLGNITELRYEQFCGLLKASESDKNTILQSFSDETFINEDILRRDYPFPIIVDDNLENSFD